MKGVRNDHVGFTVAQYLFCPFACIANGYTQYFGSDNCKITSDPKYTAILIATTHSAEALKKDLVIHQKGDTDHLTFYRQAAEAGVSKWTADVINLTCTYYNKAGEVLLVESIPVPI